MSAPMSAPTHRSSRATREPVTCCEPRLPLDAGAGAGGALLPCLLGKEDPLWRQLAQRAADGRACQESVARAKQGFQRWLRVCTPAALELPRLRDIAELKGGAMAVLRAGEGCAGVIDSIAASVSPRWHGPMLSTHRARRPGAGNRSGCPAGAAPRRSPAVGAGMGRRSRGWYPQGELHHRSRLRRDHASIGEDGTLEISLGEGAPSDVHRVRLMSSAMGRRLKHDDRSSPPSAAAVLPAGAAGASSATFFVVNISK